MSCSKFYQSQHLTCDTCGTKVKHDLKSWENHLKTKKHNNFIEINEYISNKKARISETTSIDISDHVPEVREHNATNVIGAEIHPNVNANESLTCEQDSEISINYS